MGLGLAAIGLALVVGFCELARAGDYYIDPNYAGVEGAPFGSYVAAYKSITTALGQQRNACGRIGEQPESTVLCAGCVQHGDYDGCFAL